MKSKLPIISVCMITYGHEKYIKQAIEGVLMQECDFEVELIIADDCSPDKTETIVKEFIKTHPKGSWIKYSRHTKNKGMMPNFIWAIEQCKGKYIALCEGDDYWTDALKLKKQVDFLEKHKDYSICFHRVEMLTSDNGLVNDFITEERYDKIKERPITQKELFEYSNFIHTPSVMFRNVINVFPLEFTYSPIGDYFLYFILTEHGNIHRMEEIMAVYRYGGGVYSKLSIKEKNILGKKFKLCLLSYTKSEEIKKSILNSEFNYLESSESNNVNNIKLNQLIKIILKRIKKQIFI